MPHPTPEIIAAARAALAERDPALGRIEAVTPAFEWRLRPGGFAGLAKMIVEQQVSVAAAASIWRRLEEGLGEVTPQRVLAFGVEELRAFGVSPQKGGYIRAIAEAERAGLIDFAALPALDDADAVTVLTAIKGVGRWTAETYLMFCEGRLDVFPAGDVALQEAVRRADRAESRPSEKQLYARAEVWRPWRGVAAHLCWRYYGAMKRGELPAETGEP